MKKLLFVGDSITEDGRHEDPLNIGKGYVKQISRSLKEPYEILNRGIGGNRIPDLEARWETDVLNEKPDLLSINIGVNDVWRQIDSSNVKQVSVSQFHHTYTKLVTKTKETMDSMIVLVEPTIIEEDPSSIGNQKLKDYVCIVKEVAEMFQCIHVPMHEAFIRHLEAKPDVSLTTDGVHMNELGAKLMADTWLKEVPMD